MRVVLTRREGLDWPDGVNIFIVALAEALSDLSHKVTIVTGSMRSRAEYCRLLAPRLDLDIVALSREPLSGPASAAAWIRAKRIIDGLKPDLIIHNEAVPLPFRARTVHVVHNLEPRSGRLAPFWRAIRRFSMRHSDILVASTTELREEIVRELGTAPIRFVTVPKCIDLRMYRHCKLVSRERAILHAGTDAYKEPAATVRAFSALCDPSVTLYIAGPMTAPLHEALDALPTFLQNSVVVLGEADGQTVRDLHSRVRVASFPTRYAIPVGSATVMEAIGSGTPVVGSPDLSRDVLVDGLNGLTAKTSPEALAGALKIVLDDDRLWLRLSEGAAEVVKAFDSFRVARQYLSLGPAEPRLLRIAGHRLSGYQRGYQGTGGSACAGERRAHSGGTSGTHTSRLPESAQKRRHPSAPGGDDNSAPSSTSAA